MRAKCKICGDDIVSNMKEEGFTWCHVEVPVGNGHRAVPDVKTIE